MNDDLYEKLAEPWIATKLRQNIESHKEKFPNFKERRVIEMIVDMPAKAQRWAVYQPISTFTKTIHRAQRLKSLGESQL